MIKQAERKFDIFNNIKIIETLTKSYSTQEISLLANFALKLL